MVSYSFSMPVPFSGGSISKEKAVFSLLCIRSIILISFSLSLFGEQNLFVHWEQKYEKEMRYAFIVGLFFYTTYRNSYIIIFVFHFITASVVNIV